MNNIVLFDDKEVRRKWCDNEEKWYFSIIDIIAVLTNSSNPRDYWYKMKIRVKTYDEFELSTICRQFKLTASDGKMRTSDCADTKSLLRIIQSIPSPKAEPFKLWLAKVGYERMQEMVDPSKAMGRAREYWQKQGYSDSWIEKRVLGQETRNKLTDYWKNHEVQPGAEFGILTNIIHHEWAEISVKEHKQLKELKSENLRDHMSEAELIFTSLAELSTRQIADADKATGFDENKIASKQGGGIAKIAREALEEKTGNKVITVENHFKSLASASQDK